MQLVDGITLSELLLRARIEPQQAVRVARQVCRALKHAHERFVIHRDMKPGNIMISADGPLKVVDFGTAVIMSGPPAPGLDITLHMPSPVWCALSNEP